MIKEDESKPEIVSVQAGVSAPPQDIPQDLPVVSKEERVEYRDEHGRVLDEAEVSALAGQVSFKTRYETRTRIVDAQGNEIYEGLVESRGDENQGVAPPHPDVEGQNPETQAEKSSDAPVAVAVEVSEDQQKEKSAESENQNQDAQPASEVLSATQE